MKSVCCLLLVGGALGIRTDNSRRQETNRLSLVPYPASVEHAPAGASPFQLDKSVVVKRGDGIEETDLAFTSLKSELETLSAKEAEGNQRSVNLNLKQGDSDANKESYQLTVTDNEVNVEAPGLPGLFYGVQTLRQLISVDANGVATLPAVTIKDTPRFGYRGLHLDVSRHFFPSEDVKKLLDSMSLYKMNKFHWHLTDDQGWRLPIPSLPKLTEVGAEGVQGRMSYTADEIKDVVAYAQARHIEIMPEVDVPGHAAAALAAYSELGNSDVPHWEAPSKPWHKWGVSAHTLAPKKETWSFLEKVFGTLSELFPGSMIHMGGDEADKTEWSQSRNAQLYVAGHGKKEGANFMSVSNSASSVQATFNSHVGELISKKGRVPAGWDEVLEVGGLPSNTVIFAWRGGDQVQKAVSQGKQVVNANQEVLYFDHYQSMEQEKEPRALCCLSTLDQVYNYDPMGGVSSEEQHLVLGGQGQLWSEWLPDFKQVEYMAFPRAMALAERLWTPNQQVQDVHEFRQRLGPRLAELEARDVNFRKLDK